MSGALEALRAPEGPASEGQGDTDVLLSGRGSMHAPQGCMFQPLSEFFDSRELAAKTHHAKQDKENEEPQEPAGMKQQGALAVKALGMNEPGIGDGRFSTLAGDDAARLRTWEGESEGRAKTSRASLGSHLLPGRYNHVASSSPGINLMWGIATKPINTYQMGPDCPEDSRHRVLVTKTTPPVLLLELNAVATFNMMDPDTSQDIIFGMDAVIQLLKMPKALKNRPLAYVIQGSGPHFCPGGNPNPKLYPGHTAMTVNQFSGYLPFVRCRELAIPGLCALHGSLVGGGVAYSLNNPTRIGDCKASACFGNLSRGAVPGMVLSTNIPQALGLAGAMDIYLTDSTYSAALLVKAGYFHGVQAGIQSTKQEALKQARRLAEWPLAQRITGIKPPLDVDRFGVEAWCIDLAGRVEGIFRNVGAKGPAGAQEAQAKSAPEAGKGSAEKEAAKPHQEDWNEWRLRQAKPKKRPKRRARRPPADAAG